MTDMHVCLVPVDDLGDYRSLIAVIECMPAMIDDACNTVIDQKCERPKLKIIEASKLGDMILEDNLMTYADCRYALQSFVAGQLTNIDAARDSTPRDTYDSLIGNNAVISNVVQPTTRALVAQIVGMMVFQIAYSSDIAQTTLALELHGSRLKALRANHLKSIAQFEHRVSNITSA